jgi:MSHA biogenesis protein MshI
LDTIVIEVQRSLDYYESHFAQSTVTGVVLGPLPWRTEGVLSYLSSQLGLPTRVASLEELIDLPTPLAPALQARCLLAVGAALRGGGDM